MTLFRMDILRSDGTSTSYSDVANWNTSEGLLEIQLAGNRMLVVNITNIAEFKTGPVVEKIDA